MKNYNKLLYATLLCIFIIINKSNAQIPTWQWANTAGGISEERGNSADVDHNGNVYVTGFYDTASITFGATTLSNAGQGDMYIVKYDAAGNVIWAQSAGGASFDAGSSVRCDDAGNVYVTGYFQSATIDFGGNILTNAGLRDFFIVKYDGAGNVSWAMSAGGNGDDNGFNLTTDATGNVYAIGDFWSPSITFGSTTLYAVGTSKAFVVKFDTNGNALWAAGSEGVSYDFGKSVSVDMNGNVYIAGEYYEHQVWFGTDTLNNAGLEDMFVVKFDASGNRQWVFSSGGSGTDKITDVVADPYGNVYLSGHFTSPFITFGSTTINHVGFTAWDMFVVKLDVSANVVWVQTSGNNSDEQIITGMDFDNSGNISLTGWFNNSLTLGTATMTSQGMTDLFVAKYDTAGTVLWALSAGGANQEFVNTIADDGNGNIYVTGFFDSPTLSFGATTLADANGGWDMFVAKLSVPTEITNLINHKNIIIYPNPSLGKFYISSAGGSNLKIKIFSSDGKCIYEKIYRSNEVLDLTYEPKGIYYCRIEDENGNSVIRMLTLE
jgi:hypothetical protein